MSVARWAFLWSITIAGLTMHIMGRGTTFWIWCISVAPLVVVLLSWHKEAFVAGKLWAKVIWLMFAPLVMLYDLSILTWITTTQNEVYRLAVVILYPLVWTEYYLRDRGDHVLLRRVATIVAVAAFLGWQDKANFGLTFLGSLLVVGSFSLWFYYGNRTPFWTFVWLILSPLFSVALLGVFKSLVAVMMNDLVIVEPWVKDMAIDVSLNLTATSAIWLVTARYVPDRDSVKTGVSLANAVVRVCSAFTFVISVVESSQLPAEIHELAKVLNQLRGTGTVSANTMASLVLQAVLVPYLVAGLLATALLDLRTYVELKKNGRILGLPDWIPAGIDHLKRQFLSPASLDPDKNAPP